MTPVTDPATPPASPPTGWNPWKVAPNSGFEVDDPNGEVSLSQDDDANFLVRTAFRFSDEKVLSMLRRQIGGDPAVAKAMVDVARTCPAWVQANSSPDSKTDMASVPRFLRWFENTYGLHTLAAIIHDRLITDLGPNTGALNSDTLSDRFFREMMAACGVPLLKRWIMWAAVAMRTRWAAGGYRRVTLVVWLLLATTGIAAAVASVVALASASGLAFGSSWPALAIVAVAMPFASAPLWGRQYGASIVAAGAALWILPPAVFAGAGYVVYRGLEIMLDRVAGTGGKRPSA